MDMSTGWNNILRKLAGVDSFIGEPSSGSETPEVEDPTQMMSRGAVNFPKDDEEVHDSLAAKVGVKPKPRLRARPTVEAPVPEVGIENEDAPTVEAPHEIRAEHPSRTSIDVDDPPDNSSQPERLSAIDRYMGLAGRAPRRDDYRPGTKDKLVAALLGGAVGAFGDPKSGHAIVEERLEGPYKRAAAEHVGQLEQAKTGAELEIASGKADTDREKVKGDIEAKKQALRARYAEIGVKEAEANTRYQGMLASARNAAEKNAITDAHNKEMAAISHEKNTILHEANQIQSRVAGAKEVSAAAYSRGVDQRPEIARIGKRANGPSVQQQTAAEKAAIQKVAASDPQFANFVNKYGDQLEADSGWFSSSPVPEALKAKVRAEKIRMLQAAFPSYTEPEDTDVEEPI